MSPSKRESAFVDQHVGRQVQLHRKSKGMSRSDLASTLRVSTKRMHEFELGQDRLTPAQLQIICLTLDIRPRELFDTLEIIGARHVLGSTRTPRSGRPLGAGSVCTGHLP